ncbi:MAG: outer membrane lipoprotein-sorting protein [Candidatus Aminicenantes bacterium]|nr:MAG: outer membrane lipoprotein-sorting protein [Candidatus Aminicenantes bacterium]
MKKVCLFWMTIYMVSISSLSGEKPSAVDILENIDRNMVFGTAYLEVDMHITIKGRTINKSWISYCQGSAQSYVEFLSPPRDRGTKILKIRDVIKIYYPSAERVMRLSGHMLRQSLMGSDFSYEDMTRRAVKLKEDYTAEIEAEEEFHGRPCYLLIMTSKIEKQTYFTRKTWVDKERFVGWKEELYARSGKLLKILTVKDIESINNRFYPTRVIMEDKLRENSKTEMVIKKIDFDIPIPPDTFNERRLTKKVPLDRE